MVVALLPVLQVAPDAASRDMILPAHFTAVSMWIETLRLAPALPREHRIAFANGLGTGLVVAAVVSNVVGFYLAGSAARRARRRDAVPHADVVPDLGAAQCAAAVRPGAPSSSASCMAPLLAYEQVGLDLLWTGLIGGSAAYGAPSPARGAAMTALDGLWPYLVLILVGFLPNEVWRMLGVVASRGLDEGSEIIVWVRAVATAILTGVVAKLMVFAPGALATVPLRCGSRRPPPAWRRSSCCGARCSPASSSACSASWSASGRVAAVAAHVPACSAAASFERLVGQHRRRLP